MTGGRTFTGIGVGSAHTCAVTGVGTAYCWGENSRGVVGDGTTIQRTSPVPVARGLTFTSIAVSFINSCGLNVEGAAHCWGWNREGQLGVASAEGPETCVFPPPLGGSTDCSTVPVKVVGVIFTALGRGVQNGHLCGVTGAAPYCWGLNLDGRLGTGSATGPESCAQPNALPVPCSTLAVPVAGGHTFVQVSTGGDHACGVTAQGLVYCWGVNDKGELGDGTTTRRLAPVRVSFE